MNKNDRFTGAILLALALALPAGEASALLAPQYYEQARRDAPNVLVMAIRAVTPPSGGYGDCAVAGEVRLLERGRDYKEGQSVVIAVPCVKPGAQPPLGGTVYQRVEVLSKAPFGRAYLDAGGALILSQFEPLAAFP